jgi:hypothetical protein
VTRRLGGKLAQILEKVAKTVAKPKMLKQLPQAKFESTKQSNPL